MPDPSELGKRIKKVRESLHLTLKNIEAEAGISATHISEIERGKTSPTLGALVRIATALGKDPAYFVEERDLGDVSVVTVENRIREKLPGGGTVEQLTSLIPGGRLQGGIVHLDAGSDQFWDPPSHRGHEAVRVLSGVLCIEYAGQRFDLAEGDSVVLEGNEGRRYRNDSGSGPAVFVWIGTGRALT